MHWFGDYGMGFGYGGIYMIIFWGFVVVAIFYLLKTMAGNPSSANQKPESAEEVLAKRFAKGEMTKEEFEETMEVLKKHR
jgi:putative membrane protein